MGNFFTSLFASSSNTLETEEEKLKNEQKNFDILKYDGIRALKIGKYAYAIKCFMEALNIREDFETMNHLMSTYILTGDLQKAEEVIDRMVELEPNHVETRLARVNLFFMLDKDEEGVADCQHVIAIDPLNAMAYYLMAKSKCASHDLLGTIVALTKAITLKDDFADAYLLRAEVLFEMKQAKEALLDAKKSIEIVSDNEAAYLLRGRIYASLEEMDLAGMDFIKALELDPFNEDAIVLYAQLLMAQKKYEDAIAFLNDSIETNPSSAKAYSERGRAKNLKGDKKGAFEDLKRSLELNPQGEEAQRMNGLHSNFDKMYEGEIF